MRLHGLFYTLFIFILVSCGGGGSSDSDDQNTSNNTENEDNTVIENDSNICIDCQTDLPILQIVGDTSKQNAPVTFGQVFKKGKYPANSTLIALIDDQSIPTQSDIKATHADGSVRHAVISLMVPEISTSEQDISFTLSEGASEALETVTINDVIASNLDTQLNINLYGVMINEVVFGDRSTSWFQGDLITLNINGSSYQYEVQKDGAANGDDLGTEYTIGHDAAIALRDQITAERDDVDIFVRYDRMYIKGTKAARTYAMTISNSGAAPITEKIMTTETETVTYNLNIKDALQNSSERNNIVPWLQGDIASEWIVSAPLINPDTQQKNSQLVAQFHIRAYSDPESGIEKIKTDIIIENPWSFVDDVSNLFYDISISSNGQEVFSDSIEHFAHSRWKKTIWWGEEPDYEIKQDIGYLIATKAVPNYDIAINASEIALQNLEDNFSSADFDLMHVGSATQYMPQTGAHIDIGPVPGWQALYLISNDSRAEQSTLLHSDLAGTWSIHYRNENTNSIYNDEEIYPKYKNTNLPVTIDDFSHMTILGRYGDTYNPKTGEYDAFNECSGYCLNPYTHDNAHQPSFSYLPYLITGDYYHMEELAFWANYNLFSSNPYYRSYTNGLFQSGQVRGQAWSLRTLGQAAYIIPDDYPLKSYFIKKVGNNLEYYNENYTNNASANKLGIITNGYAIGYNDYRGIAPWQQDFFTWSIGYLNELDFAEALPFLEWMSKFQIERMGESIPQNPNNPTINSGFCWISGAVYSLNIRDNAESAIYETLETAYLKTIDPAITSLGCESEAMAAALKLKVGEMTGYSYTATGFPSNYQPALAVVTDLDTAQSRTAWNVFSNRSVQPNNYDSQPQFAILPRITFDPENVSESESNQNENSDAEEDSQNNNDTGDSQDNNNNVHEPVDSLSQIEPGTWYEIPDSNLSTVLPSETPFNQGGSKSIMTAWSGGAFDTDSGKLIVWGGGHADYSGNEIYTFDTNTQQWERPWGPTPNDLIQEHPSQSIEAYLDGNPSSRHTYAGLVYMPAPYNSLWAQGGSRWRNGYDTYGTWQFDFDINQWLQLADAPDTRYGVAAVYDPITNHIFSRGRYYINKYDPETDVWTRLYNQDGGWPGGDSNAAIAPDRRIIIYIGGEQIAPLYGVYDIETDEYFVPDFSGNTEILYGSAPGIAYHPPTDSVIAWNGGSSLYQLDLDTWEWTAIEVTDNGTIPDNAATNGTYGRFQYVPEHDVFIVVNSIYSNVFAFKLPE